MKDQANTFCEAERRRLKKIEQGISLPNSFKRIGVLIAVVSFLLLLGNSFFGAEADTVRLLSRKILLVSLLIVAISREKIEDEMIAAIRGRAFALAFVIGVIYALVQPYFDYAVLELVKGDAVYKDMNVFQLLLVMLGFYIVFFQGLKRMQ